MNNGYSTLWLIILYLIGGYIKKYNPFQKFKAKILSVILVVLFVLIWLSRVVIELATIELFGEVKWGGVFTTYLSPLVVATAVVMLELFSRIKFNKKPIIITILASVSFGVYLIHENEFIKLELMVGAFKSFATFNPVLMVLAVLGAAICIYLICSIVDYCRLCVFNLFRIKPFLLRLESKLKQKLIKE